MSLVCSYCLFCLRNRRLPRSPPTDTRFPSTPLFRAPLLAGRGEPPSPAVLKGRVAGVSREALIYIGAFGAVVVTWQLIQYQDLVGWLLALAGDRKSTRLNSSH